jgi:hypothetical protein
MEKKSRLISLVKFSNNWRILKMQGPNTIQAPTCFDCQNASIDSGYSGDRENPPEPATCDCNIYDQDSEYFDSLFEGDASIKDFALYCRHFTPIMINECPVCQFQMNQPNWSWDIHVLSVDVIPVCSASCQKILQDKVDREIAEMQQIPDLRKYKDRGT